MGKYQEVLKGVQQWLQAKLNSNADDRKEREERAERYRILAENTLDTMVLVDNQAIVRYVSPSFTSLSGYSIAKYEGLDAFEIIYPEDRERVRLAYASVLQTKLPVTTQYRVIHAKGETIYIEARVKPVLDENNTMNKEQNYEPVREWLLQNKETTLLSICAGADNLAATGLLNGKLAATHWQTMPVLTKKYPEVNWINDQRYVVNDGGKMISSAGISSGIDAVLYVIAQQLGEPMAEKIAQELHYPTFNFVNNPQVEPFSIDLGYSTYLLNNAFQWSKKGVGVMLYDGVEEMSVASVFDIYYDTGTTRVHALSSSEQPIVTKHGLYMLARHTFSNIPQLDKIIIPGREAKSLATEEIEYLNEQGNAKELQFVHADSPNRFLFEVQLEDLAQQEDMLTAKHALKRLEYRATDIQLEGKPFPLETYSTLLLTIAVAILIALYVDRRFILRRILVKQHR